MTAAQEDGEITVTAGGQHTGNHCPSHHKGMIMQEVNKPVARVIKSSATGSALDTIILCEFPEGETDLYVRPELSDLEIMQKALKSIGKNGGTLVFQDDGSSLIYEYPRMNDPMAIGFADHSDLLTWAKQTIGGE